MVLIRTAELGGARDKYFKNLYFFIVSRVIYIEMKFYSLFFKNIMFKTKEKTNY